ncbi:FAD-binding oxidoreductase [Mesorhizobium sp.]|uniref:NAD(P)/FAD-dependent oxidoreductase n=1 Tax=Mesorhizobium sp. TaxID=1871066 RepID=UPI000FEA0EC5|nr:FAD-binding oxidoreductase [Mesorhizobium sp.]RWI66743.1 MAG: FAD-binding oxidoreductase [Mesorhizobium sp.]TIN16154.1 MAG: FAD-binding oxidoreductase [Mesorhizobium sp.]
MLKSISAPRYAAQSGWNALLPQRVPHEQLPKQRRYYAIVIGAGYTGLGTARRVAELIPEKEILVIEASEIGEGSSARNSGFLGVYPNSPHANAYGSADDDAARKIRIVAAGLDWLRSLVKKHKIDCDWNEKTPRIIAAATSGGERGLRSYRRSLETWNTKCLEHSPEELRRFLGTDYYRYGIQQLNHALVQPAALIRGLADTLPSNVTMLECATVEAIGGTGPFRVQTHRGGFTADKVFIANNAHARTLGLLTDRMIGVYTYGALTPPLDTDELNRLGNLPAWGVLPASKMGTTMRKTLQRFLIRSSASYEKESDPEKVRSILTRLFQRRFPGMHSYELEYVWGGVTAITSNGEGYFGELRPGLYVSAGCQGAGVLRGSIQGKLLAEMACGSQSSLLTDRLMLTGPNWIPPEPFRGIGAIARMTWAGWRAGREY